MNVTEEQRKKREAEYQREIHSAPVKAEHLAAVDLARHYRELWEQRKATPRVCDFPGCPDYQSHHGRLS